jgi:tryptophanyl-tRNA synthetase
MDDLKVDRSDNEVTIIQEQKITPWDVKGALDDKGQIQAVDYDKLIVQFGSKKLDISIIDRIARLTGKPVHPLIRRGVFFSHRELDTLLELYEKGKPFYLYTGRGPSSSSMHLGHMVPFYICKYLQEVFQVPLVIQMTDDEKFLWKDITLEQARQFAIDNAKDIIAVGFDVKKTFIFSDVDYIR